MRITRQEQTSTIVYASRKRFKVSYERGGVEVVRIGAGAYVVIECDERAVQWRTARSAGGEYFASGVGESSRNAVLGYAMNFGIHYRTKAAAIAVVDEAANIRELMR